MDIILERGSLPKNDGRNIGWENDSNGDKECEVGIDRIELHCEKK